MIMGMMIGVVIQALLTMLILYIVARHEADLQFPKLMMVCALIVAADAAFSTLLAEKIGFIAELLSLPIAVLLIHKVCWVSLPKSILAVFLLLIVNTATFFGMGMLMATLFGPAEGQQAEQERRMAEVDAAFEDLAYMSQQGQPTTPEEGAQSTQIPSRRDAGPARNVTVPRSTARGPVPEEEAWALAKESIEMNGEMKNGQGQTCALIGPNVYVVGETFSVQNNGFIYTWRLLGARGSKLDLEQIKRVRAR